MKRLSTRLFLCLFLASLSNSAAAQQFAPEVTAIEPKAAITTPGSKVTVFGTGLTLDAVVYFDGVQARETKFISPSELQVLTPFLRSGSYQLQFKSGSTSIRSEVTFVASRSQVDSDIDRAIALAAHGETSAALAALAALAKSHPDYQVRSFAHYQMAKIYFAQGDFWRSGGEAAGIYDDGDKSGMAVQTSWRYRLALNQNDYLLPTSNDPEHDLTVADWTVKYDVTENPEPRFFRGLVNARYGNLSKAKADCDFILSKEPDNASYRALAAYVAVLGGDKASLKPFSGQVVTDGRALGLLGEAAYLSGDTERARRWWVQAAATDPLGVSLAYWAGKKHLARGQRHVAVALLTECIVMAPAGKDAKDARDLLAKVQEPASE
jgi:tetratricopeptide (TPR) repeat protein